MNLILDFGNTFLKVALFEGGQIHSFERIPKGEKNQILSRLKSKDFTNCILSSVINIDSEIITYLEKKSEYFLQFDLSTNIPLVNLYKTPQTLGKDRLALAVAAQSKFRNENVLVIDAGSCITFDFVNKKGEYLGGSIHPGIEMRYKALHEYTDNLPHVEFDESFIDLIGNDTESSIKSGIQTGVIKEIEGIINAYKNLSKSLKIIVCGGNSNYLATNLKNSIFADEKFMLYGLNQILLFNE